MRVKFRKLISPPVFPGDDEKTRVAAILNVILWILLGVVLLSEPLLIYMSVKASTPLILKISAIWAPVTIVSLMYLLQKGYVNLTAWVFLLVQWLSTNAQILLSGGLESPALPAFVVSILLAGFLIGRRVAYLITGLSLASILFFVYAETNHIIPLPTLFDTPAGKFRMLTSTLIVTAAMLSLVIQSLKTAIRKLQEEATERQRIEVDLRGLLKQEQQLNEVTRTISSKLDLSIILSTVVQLTSELVEADAGSMSLVSPDGQTISHHNLFNLPEGLKLDKPVPRESGLSWQVIETKQSVLLANYGDYSNTLPDWEATGLHSLIEVPLIAGDACLGTLSVARRDPDSRFTERELALVESVGRQTAIAIQNARLFEAQQRELAERARIEKEREKLIMELEERNAELTRFNYTVSHELRAPIVTIKGFLGSIEKDLQHGNYDRANKDFYRVSNAADKMHNTLFGLLELSRVRYIINPPEKIHLSELAQEALEIVENYLQIHTHNITFNIAPDFPVVTGDRVRLREVLENLITNAANYMGEQTSPHIEIGVRKGEEPIFFVKDNGVGIDPKYHEKIFGLFEKLDPSSEGIGIGLALVKRIIEMHGGEVWVESDGLGKGSTFCFTLPDREESYD